MNRKTTSELGVLTRILHGAVRGYQRLAAGRPTPCRFVPTCSNYALDALEQHGAGRGTRLIMGRLCRCHPWGGHGWDPVPLTGSRSPVVARPTEEAR